MKKYCPFILILLPFLWPIFLNGQKNFALSLDGVDDYISLGRLDTSNDISNGYTIEAWIYFKDVNNTSGVIFDLGNGPNADNIILSHDLNNFTFSIWQGDDYLGGFGQQYVFNDNAWNHIAITQGSTGMCRFYINGSAIGFRILSRPSRIVRDSCYIGKKNWRYDGFLYGDIAQFRLFNIPMSLETIKDWMYRRIDSTHPEYGNLVINQDFDDGKTGGNRVTDSRGNNTGTLYNINDLSPANSFQRTSGWIYSNSPNADNSDNVILLDPLKSYITIKNNEQFHFTEEATLESRIKICNEQSDFKSHQYLAVNCINPDYWGILIWLTQDRVPGVSCVIADHEYDLYAHHSLPADGQFHTISGVRKADSLLIYIDGKYDNWRPLPSGNLRYGNASNHIGRAQVSRFLSSNPPYLMEFTRFWNVARTAEQVGNYAISTPRFDEKGLVGSYRFQQTNAHGNGLVIKNDATSTGSAADGTTVGDDESIIIADRSSFKLCGNKAQSIFFSPLNDKQFGDTALLLEASASSKLPVKFRIVSGPASIDNKSYLTILGAGEIRVEASQQGNEIYAAAEVVIQNFNVAKAGQVIKLSYVKDTTQKALTYLLSGSSSSGLPVSFSVEGNGVLNGNRLTFTGAGLVSVKAVNPGNDNYESASSEAIQFCISAGKPGSISGYRKVCPGTQSYSVPNVEGVHYEWHVDAPAIFTAVGNEASITWPDKIGIYRIKVLGYADCDQKIDSTTVDVTVESGNLPTKVTGLFPAAGTIINDFPSSLSWQPSAEADHYQLFIYDSASLPNSPNVDNIAGIGYPLKGGDIKQLTPGKRYFWNIGAINGCGETLSDTSTFIIGQLPNLIVTNVKVADSVFAGNTIDVEYSIKNDGKASTREKQWQEGIWISASKNIDETIDAQYLGGSGNIRALEPGESYENSVRVQLPNNIQIGKRFLVVKTNVSSSLGETSTADNTRADSTIEFTPDLPNLTVMSPVLFSPSDPFSGDKITVNYQLKNNGKAPLRNGSWTEKFYIDLNPNLDINSISSAIPLGQISRIGTLEIDSLRSMSAELTLPYKIHGVFYVYVLTNAGNEIYETFSNDNLKASPRMVVTLRTPPDFVVTDIISKTEVSAGETIRASMLVTNFGANPPYETEKYWEDAFYLSYNPVFRLKDAIQLAREGFVAASPLTLGTSYRHELGFVIPSTIRDSAYLFAYTNVSGDVFEFSRDTNNVRSKKIYIVNPDLVIDSLDFPKEAQAGKTITIRYRIRNIGKGKVITIPRKDRIWLVNDPLSAEESFIDDVPVSGVMDSAATTWISKAVLIPATFAGTKYFRLYSDIDNSLPETVETNNNYQSRIPLLITAATYPDLIVNTANIISDKVEVARNYAFSYSVQNGGSADLLAGSWNDRIFLSASNTWDPSKATPVKAFPQSMTILKDGTYEVTDSISIRLSDLAGKDSGNFYLYVFADADGQVPESGPVTNNISRTGIISISHPPFPDLAVTLATGKPNVKAGMRTAVSYTVINKGGTYGYAASWADAVYLSANKSLQGARLIGTKSIFARLEEGDKYSVTINALLPSDVSGPFYLLLVTDYNSVNSDADRANNIRAVALNASEPDKPGVVNVSPDPASDLSASFVSIPVTGITGQPLAIKWSVVNHGHLTNKSAWTDRIFLSQSTILQTSDPVLYTVLHNGSLDSTKAYADSALVLLPPNLAGNYYLILQSDANEVLHDAARENNIVRSDLFIGSAAPPDLVVTKVTAAPGVRLGDLLTVAYTIKNIGLNPAVGYLKFGITLSPDTSFTGNNFLSGQDFVQLNLPPLATDSFTTSFKVRNISPGVYHAVVRSDVLNNFAESDEANNDAASGPVSLGISMLTLEEKKNDTLLNNDEHYYELSVPDSLAGSAIEVSIKGQPEGAANELYIRYREVPTRSSYDLAYDRAGKPDQFIVIPEARPGKYYIMSFSQTLLQKQPVELLATRIPFQIREVSKAEGGNTGLVSVKVDGALFETGMQATLVNESLGTITAESVEFKSSTSSYVTFNLSGSKPGKYKVKLTKKNSTQTTWTGTYTVVPGSAGGLSGGNNGNGFYCYLRNASEEELLDIKSNYPPYVRTWQVFPTILVYGNSGNVNIPIPVRILTCLENLPVSADPTEMLRNLAALLGGQAGEELVETLIQFAEPGFDKWLRPGYQGSKIIFSALPFDNTYTYRLIEK